MESDNLLDKTNRPAMRLQRARY